MSPPVELEFDLGDFDVIEGRVDPVCQVVQLLLCVPRAIEPSNCSGCLAQCIGFGGKAHNRPQVSNLFPAYLIGRPEFDWIVVDLFHSSTFNYG